MSGLNIRLVLDSGAFTAWKKGTEIDLEDYINYIKANIEHIDHYINLDVIPGSWGRIPSPQEVETSARRGWENLLRMEEEGLKPVPVFHQGEGFHWLERLIEHGCDYIGISPANDRTTQQKRLWLDRVFGEVVCDKDGWPRIKTHGFGMTSLPLLFRYPWYSADSTSWLMFASYGMIIVPAVRNGEFRYDTTPDSIFVSERHKSRTEEGAHFDSYPPSAQAHILKYFDICGVTLEQVRTSYHHRILVTAKFFRDVGEKKPNLPFHRQRVGFFA